MAATSDSVLQNLRLQRQENSFAKIQKYEQVADKLIAGNFAEEDRLNLQQEYRTIKNQLNYHLFPLKQINNLNTVSWNRQMLETEENRNKIGEKFQELPKPPNEVQDFGKTYLVDKDLNFSRSRMDSQLLPLPEINKISEKNFIHENPS